MSGRYARELAALPRTYEIAKAWDTRLLARALERAQAAPLIVVGSGGSFSVASYCAGLHQQFSHEVSKAVTPLGFLDQADPGGQGLLCISASGRNADIRAAYQKGVRSELRPAIAFTLTADNPLHELAGSYAYADALAGPTPAEPDGFLAVNSVIATCLSFARAYRSVHGLADVFPKSFAGFLEATLARNLDDIQQSVAVRSRDVSLSILYSPDLEAAAVDLESRFVEAALAPLHIADLRNFGHGRHNWIAKRTTDTLAIALANDRYHDLAARTLKLFPPEAAVERIDFSGAPDVAGLSALLVALHITAGVGEAVGVDPGRPGIPEFGRKLFHLTPPKQLTRVDPIEAICRRKLRAIQHVGARCDPAVVAKACTDNYKLLRSTPIASVVLDYDGTICDPRTRFDPIPEEMAAALVRVLELGVPLGIATGRGKSVGKELRSALPQALWERVAVGYYNCNEIVELADEAAPHEINPSAQSMRVVAALSSLPFADSFKVEPRGNQVTVTPRSTPRIQHFTACVQASLAENGVESNVVMSGHSVDVLAPGITKTAMVAYLGRRFGFSGDSILRIGDRGAAPGNDHELLRHPLGLSVDDVSPDLGSCWRWSPPGHIGPQALLGYLGGLRAVNGRVLWAGTSLEAVKG